MKELSIKDETLDVVRQMVADGQVSQEVAEKYFPALKESEDERIRKELINYFLPVDARDSKKQEWIAWLEKHGEQKPAVDTKVVIPKFRVGDIVKSKSQPMLSPRKIISIGKDCYWCEDRGCIGFAWEDDCEIVEQKTAWSEDDEIHQLHTISLIEDIKDWANKDGMHSLCIARCIESLDWLNSLKDRVQPQPKQEWSEDDENRINRLIAYFEDKESFTAEDDVVYANWLKSLRPQVTWKPSEEQMGALRDAIVYVEGCNSIFKGSGSVLEKLYNDLKKLREQ